MALVIARNGREDFDDIAALYRRVATVPGGLARNAEEITDDWVRQILDSSLDRGISLGARNHPLNALVGEIHAYRPVPQVFAHVWSDLTVAVDPDLQGAGIGRALFEALLQEVKERHPEVLRIELLARESNRRAIRLYESLGFKTEGRLEDRVRRPDGGTEADLHMAWKRA